jgi:hypothetical protein
LYGRATGHDHERVGDDRPSGEVEYGNVFAFLILGGVAYERDQIDFRQGFSPPQMR